MEYEKDLNGICEHNVIKIFRRFYGSNKAVRCLSKVNCVLNKITRFILCDYMRAFVSSFSQNLSFSIYLYSCWK